MVIKRKVADLSSVRLLLAQILLAVTVIATPAQAQSPVGWWKFDEGSGTKAADSSGNSHTATLFNGVSWVTGKIGDAVSANAAKDQYVSIPKIDLSGTNAITVALWTNRTYSTSGGHALFEATRNYNNSTTGFGFFPDDATCDGIQAALRGNLGYVANCYSQPSSGVWHHLAVVFDKSQTGGDQVTLYVDGVLQTVDRNLYASTNTNNFGNNPIYLFSRAGTSEFNSGIIDDLRIYNGALTAEQIQQIYVNSGLVSIAVTPANPSIGAGNQQQLAATGTYSDGSHQDLTSSATWTSSIPSSATVSSGGLATGVAAGNTTIEAASGSINGSTGLTITPPQLEVSLAWTGSSSPGIAGYNAYRSTISGGPYTKLNSSLISTTSYSDQTVQNGYTYYYVTTAVNSQGMESVYSNQAVATVGSNFTISASPSSLSVVQGNQGTSTLTTAISGGFNSAISLSASGVPTGTTVSFNPQSIPAPGSGNSTMTITVGASTPVGSYPITVTGNGGGVQQNATVTLTVTA